MNWKEYEISQNHLAWGGDATKSKIRHVKFVSTVIYPA